MARISPLTVVVAYDLGDKDVRDSVRDFLEEELAAVERTESVYELIYAPPPDFVTTLRRLRSMIDPEAGDLLYVWDLEKGALRRIAVHKLRTKTLLRFGGAEAAETQQ